MYYLKIGTEQRQAIPSQSVEFHITHTYIYIHWRVLRKYLYNLAYINKFKITDKNQLLPHGIKAAYIWFEMRKCHKN